MRRRLGPAILLLVTLAACSSDPPPPPAARPTESASPTASPSPTGPCAQYPGPACTGVPKGTTLTKLKLNMDGETLRITKRGTVLDKVHVPGNLLITANDVTITNSQIDGQIMGVYDEKRYSFTVADSTVGPTDRCDTAPGILDAQFTATRVHIRGHGDGFSVSGDNVTITDSYVKLCSNPGDHSDGIQTVGASKNLTFHHNTVDQRDAPSRTAPVFLVDPTEGVTVTDNLLIGGTYTLQVRTAPGAVARNNAIVNESWDFGPASVDCGNTTWEENKLVTIDEHYNVTSVVAPLECPT
ncbi:right-handed parallel beta-helix repeat-containing protein [Acrocarpospora catenulata]|uniref:right-handed parallel beta-helix repeat-containing protein n=1 Tax=Acrocarpospora catenulata TaxID=2836182 RepID=UPI001BDB5B18|nr:right-handed parallel beta-helix repeat-containing protein [Acrocarpospora catenulata]